MGLHLCLWLAFRLSWCGLYIQIKSEQIVVIRNRSFNGIGCRNINVKKIKVVGIIGRVIYLSTHQIHFLIDLLFFLFNQIRFILLIFLGVHIM